MNVRTCTPAIDEGVERRRHHRGQRLPLAGLHLDDMSGVEGQAGDDLFVERPLAEDTAGRLARERKHLAPERAHVFPRPRAGAKSQAATLDFVV